MTTRKQVNLNKMIVRTACQRAVLQSCQLGIATRRIVGVRTVVLAIAADVVHQLALLRNGHLLGDRPIGLTHLATANHLVQAHQCLARLGKEHRATHGAVDAMHHAQKNVTRFTVALLDEGLDLILQRALTRRVGLHQITTMFIDHQQVVILVNNVFYCKHNSL